MSDRRLATALQKVLDMFTSLSGLGAAAVLPLHNDDCTITNEAPTNKVNKVSAQSLQLKVNKLLKLNNTTRKYELALTNDIALWLDSILNQECSQFIKDFNQLLLSQLFANTQLTQRMEKIKLSLSFVNERERKQQNLLATRYKLEKQFRDSRNKYGPDASSTILIKEKLEEIECNLQVVEQQYIRSILNDLRESLMEYIYTLNAASRKLKMNSDDCMDNFNAIEHGYGNIASGIGKNLRDIEIARVSPEKYARLSDATEAIPKETHSNANANANSNANANANALLNTDINIKRPKRKPPPPFTEAELIKLRDYDLPTPQSMCNDCKKAIPCIHTEGASHQSLKPQKAQFQQRLQSQSQSQLSKHVDPQIHQQDEQRLPYSPTQPLPPNGSQPKQILNGTFRQQHMQGIGHDLESKGFMMKEFNHSLDENEYGDAIFQQQQHNNHPHQFRDISMISDHWN